MVLCHPNDPNDGSFDLQTCLGCRGKGLQLAFRSGPKSDDNRKALDAAIKAINESFSRG